MRTALIALVAAVLAGPALAQQPGVPVPGAADAANIPVNQRIVYGDDPCTEGEDPEAITICVRYSEDERFRVPPNLRNNPNDPASQAWANRAIELSYVGRTGTESCSTVGAGGFTGCFNQIVRQARAERADNDDVNWARLIEEARQRRLAEIDAAAAAEEEAERANRPD